ncbi:MAG TPA: hypothetical protein ENF93_01555 [Ignisphaera sp.]|nr:hypothetical protein [Ignisphaera sp.]
MRSDRLALYTPSRDEIEEARELIEESRLNPRIPSIDLPEALCLIIGRRRGYIVLTENRAALLIPKLIARYRNVVVWRALEILLNAIKEGLIEVNCENPYSVFDEYSRDTLHIFPSRALERAVSEVRSLCVKK